MKAKELVMLSDEDLLQQLKTLREMFVKRVNEHEIRLAKPREDEEITRRITTMRDHYSDKVILLDRLIPLIEEGITLRGVLIDD